MQVALQRGAYLAQGVSHRGGLSHEARDIRSCHPGGDDACHHRYRDGFSAQPHRVGQGLQWGAIWTKCSRRLGGAADGRSGEPIGATVSALRVAYERRPVPGQPARQLGDSALARRDLRSCAGLTDNGNQDRIDG